MFIHFFAMLNYQFRCLAFLWSPGSLLHPVVSISPRGHGLESCHAKALKGNVKKTSSWSIREKLDDQWLINHCQSARYQNNDNLLVNKSSDSRMFFQFAMFAGVTGGSYKHMKQWMCRLKNMKTMCILTISLYIFDYVYMHVRTYVIRR